MSLGQSRKALHTYTKVIRSNELIIQPIMPIIQPIIQNAPSTYGEPIYNINVVQNGYDLKFRSFIDDICINYEIR